jgi:hypothetical protein
MGSMNPLSILQSVGGVVGTVLPVVNAASTLTKEIKSFGVSPQEEAAAKAARDLAAQQKLAMRQLQEQQTLAEQQDQAAAAREQAAIAADAANAEESRRAALKRAVARQKVSLAAQGVSAADDGSAEAILLGLFQESETEKAQRARLDGLRSAALDTGLAEKKAINVLQRAQLAEKQRLARELLA